jgi:hypothetical protein
MKRFLLFALAALFFGTTSANAQNYTYFTEYFDDGATAITGTTANAATTPTTATIKSGTWTTYYSFRAGSGCLPQDPAVTSAKQLRILGTGATTPGGLSSNPNGPNAYLITPTLPYGVNTITFKNLQTGGSIAVYTSTTNGASWTLAQSVTTLAAGCTADYTVTVNDAAVNKIKFQNETTSNQELDNITITSVNPILPVTIFNAKAYTKEAGVQIDWKVGAENNVAKYIVERAINSRDFAAVASVEAKGNSSYSAFDASPVAGVNYYRIKVLDNDGSFKYSAVLTVNITKTKAEVVVAPNPVKNGQLNLQIGGLEKGTYSLRMYNDLGQEVFVSQISTTGGSLSQLFTLPSTVKAGMYNLQLSGGEVKISKRVVVQ